MASWSKVQVFVKRIISWYREHGRHNLPWRRTSDPWAVLIAAFLLRKTTSEQVLRVYSKFLEKFPTPEALLEADEAEIRELIRSLGIEHQRAKHLKEVARAVVERYCGKVPSSKEELKKLPGVGEYIASEVLLIAYGQPEPLLDRNMIRVLERVFSIKSSKKRPHTDRKLWDFAKKLVPHDPNLAKEFNYGVLDFARQICTAKAPKCSVCILKSICDWYKQTGSQRACRERNV